jgi:hypothetical protein
MDSDGLLASVLIECLSFTGELPALIAVFPLGDPTGVEERCDAELFLD